MVRRRRWVERHLLRHGAGAGAGIRHYYLFWSSIPLLRFTMFSLCFHYILLCVHYVFHYLYLLPFAVPFSRIPGRSHRLMCGNLDAGRFGRLDETVVIVKAPPGSGAPASKPMETHRLWRDRIPSVKCTCLCLPPVPHTPHPLIRVGELGKQQIP